ncbi:hypothetical protein MPSEU_000947400 [Mayamaea pseudoterrestris]|nr:hypothetical protein MPSEU_000947400 [Mayamaea pseudoterrestris]
MTKTIDSIDASSNMQNCWISTPNALASTECLCLGTGRFLRSVLVPAFVEFGPVALIQTRGTSFISYMRENGGSGGKYPVDTVLESGEVRTDEYACAAAFSFGTPSCKEAFYAALPNVTSISMIGVGVTEAGLASAQTQVMKDLFELLQMVRTLLLAKQLQEPKTPKQRISVINTDNIPENGSLLLKHMMSLANQLDPTMVDFLQRRIVFHNTMVDRITSHRLGPNGEKVPRAEPIPDKALVILDESNDLPLQFLDMKHLGVVVRTQAHQLRADISLKLRVANGTHTAIAHLLALLKQTMTTCLSAQDSEPQLLVKYLDSLFSSQILPAAVASLSIESSDCQAVYTNWRTRLLHPHFGLSSFFVTQNGAAKGGIRLSPTVLDLMERDIPVNVVMAFAFAVLLRWLTPTKLQSCTSNDKVYTGSFSKSKMFMKGHEDDDDVVEYADKMRYNLSSNWYEFKCACQVQDGDNMRNLSEWLGSLKKSERPDAYYNVVCAYLMASDGGNLATMASKPAFKCFAKTIATLYARMIVEDDLASLLMEMGKLAGNFCEGFATKCESFSPLGDE